MKNEAGNEMTGYPSIDKPWLKYYSKTVEEFSPKTIYEYARKTLTQRYNEDCICYYGENIKSKDVLRQIDRCADAFWALGIREGDCVTICSPTFPETIYANIALNKIGAIANNIDPRNNVKALAEDINKVNSKAVIVLDLAVVKIRKIESEICTSNIIVISYGDSIPFIKQIPFNAVLRKKLKAKGIPSFTLKWKLRYCTWHKFLMEGKIAKAEISRDGDNCVAAMVRTSGTTGKPKSVMLTNKGAISLVEQYKTTDLNLKEGESLLNIMPQFIAYGWTFGVVMTTCLGIINIIVPQFDQKEFAQNIIKYHPNHLVAVPTHYINLMEDPQMEQIDFSGWLHSISAGGDKFLEQKENAFNKWLNKHNYSGKVIVGYGLTEMNSSVATRLHCCNVPTSAGIPLPQNIISIFKYDEGMQASTYELKYGEVGEICITGPSMMAGYYNDIEETQKIERLHDDGRVWIHTKDKGYMNKNGVLYVLGREKNMIIRPDGHNVWPIQMENVILHHEAVKDCCVVGIPCGQGELPRAVVVLKEQKNKERIERELREMCLQELPERDVPITYSFEEQLPLTDVGKIDVAAVRAHEIEKEIS